MARQRAQGVSGDICPPQKLENFVFLHRKSCNLVNTFRRKFSLAGDELKNIVFWV